MILVALSACTQSLQSSITETLGRFANESGEQQDDYAFFVVLVVIAALALVFVVGPQVTAVYAQTAQTGAVTP